ncbi:MAG: citryl-CoA lyase [Patescibacteria group bacterium]
MHWNTAITDVQAEKECIRGYDLQELIQKKSFVETIFLLLRGELPNENETRMLNAIFTAAIDHGPGTASGMTVRIVAAAKNSLHTSVAAGILAMGERHGSSIEGAAKFFQEHIGEQDIESWIKKMKERKERVPGYGHAVLTHDRRADGMFTMARETGFYGRHCLFAVEVGEILNTASSKKLPMNVDGAMAAILSDMGFPWDIMKGFFIIARVPGLVAHAYEEMTEGDGLRRLAEDDVHYTGQKERSLQ